MTITNDRPATTPVAGPTTRTPALLGWLGGLSMIAAPLLVTAGNATAPPQASSSSADYIVSLARDPFLTNTSATLLHYGWVAMAFGLLAGIGLVRGRRGQVLTLIGGLGGAFGSIQLSGMLLSDYFNGAAGRIVAIEQAVAIFETPSLSRDIWLNSAKVGAILLPLLFFVGLARAGVLSWKLLPLLLVGTAGLVLGGMIGGPLGLAVATVLGLVSAVPNVVVGQRLIVRSRLAAA